MRIHRKESGVPLWGGVPDEPQPSRAISKPAPLSNRFLSDSHALLSLSGSRDRIGLVFLSRVVPPRKVQDQVLFALPARNRKVRLRSFLLLRALRGRHKDRTDTQLRI